MLNDGRKCDIIRKKRQGMWLDFMNRNTIISLAMLYAIWESKRQDLLDLIRPFVLFSIGYTTKTGERIDPISVGKYMENEFGYRSFQIEVVNKILSRETSSDIPKEKRLIVRRNNAYYLIGSLSKQIEEFSTKRTACKTHSDAVTSALSEYFNKCHVNNRDNYTQAEAEAYLLSFFERQGSAILLSVEDLRQIMAKNNEVEYFIGKFILAENDKSSVLMDYLVELVKGYFITTALYLQAENNDITRASFSDVTFFLDTRILLGLLGYKTEQENTSVQEMVKSLQRHSAKLACFVYNEEEVYSILEAYKQATIKGSRNSYYTLEYFDTQKYSSSLVDIAQRQFKERLKESGITSFTPEQVLSDAGIENGCQGLLDDSAIQILLLKINPDYRLNSFPDDFSAINSVSRVRKGERYPNIEKCKAVFATTNTTLVHATKQYMLQNSLDYGFPLAISESDLCVLAWLKDFEQDNNLPQMRLLENVLAAITPNKDLMDAYFSILNNMEEMGSISSDEVSLLRVDLFARNELMELTRGEKERLTSAVIEEIREKIKRESFIAGIEQGKIESEEEYKKQSADRRNAVCRKAEEEIEDDYKKKENKIVNIVRVVSVIAAIVFIGASVVSFLSQWSSPVIVALLLVAIVATYQGAKPFFSDDNWIIKMVKLKLQKDKLKAIDKRKEQYLAILDTNEVE